ncbi:pre-mRNA processing factor 3-domain-containing protein [Mycotypha africana]|uniref:pre-mRNA processing factor 3-domain-containing protein n=1 Tax=Mycotypha africana TaxID=64632 RepID=UPI00230088BC|nr:pre-mRNA processing factor 3-domain-containing protein [Mycotypha africana]KAI8991110.1 pre-mRNA processing factor 3-domain-containing protein [Mycotypha africana]
MAQFQAKQPNRPSPQPTSASGTSGSLSMAEIQRKIAEAKARIAAGTGALTTANASGSPLSGRATPNHSLKPPALPLSGEVDLKAMLDTGLIPRRETVNTKAMQRSKQKSAAASIPAIASPAAAASTSTSALAEKKKAFKLVDTVPPEFTDPTKNPYFDPSMEVKIAPKQRRARQLKFVQPGKYVAIANQERAKAQLEKLKQEITESVKKAGMQAELDVSDKVIKRDPPPAVEWWDAPFLPNKTYEDVPAADENDMAVDFDPAQFDTLVTMYVHHPVPIQAPYEANQTPIVRSLMLTKKELKKMRRQRRAEALKDKRDKIRLGLLEPDAPKVKISNLMRVLGDEAIQDPTKVEAKVRKEMELRQKMHEKANEQRKLTPEEKRAKILNKLKEDQKHVNEAAVFK